LGSHELGLKTGLAIFKEHADDFSQVPMEFIERFPLGVCARKARYVTNEKAGVPASFDYGSIARHEVQSSVHLEGFEPG
jgi:hypothetical protein